MSEKLKPCPFCGEKPEVIQSDGGAYKGMWRVAHRCQHMGYIDICDWCEEITENRVSGWNHRVSKEAPDA